MVQSTENCHLDRSGEIFKFSTIMDSSLPPRLAQGETGRWDDKAEVACVLVCLIMCVELNIKKLPKGAITYYRGSSGQACLLADRPEDDNNYSSY